MRLKKSNFFIYVDENMFRYIHVMTAVFALGLERLYLVIILLQNT